MSIGRTFRLYRRLGGFQVFLAQPVLWGLTYNGQKGVEDVLGIVINEFDNTMALAGVYLLV